MRLVFISDTHGKHYDLRGIPDGDVLIHTGDFSFKMRQDDTSRVLRDFDNWLSDLPHPHKIVIAGNHEIGLNELSREETAKMLPSAIYLQDSSVEISGIKFFGSPWTSSKNYGFSASRDTLKKKWKAIPKDTDVLLTHMPPFGIKDLAFDPRGGTPDPCTLCDGSTHPRYRHWGCRHLLDRVQRKIKPVIHAFGHVHDDSGVRIHNETVFVNSSTPLIPKARVIDISPTDKSVEVIVK